VSLQDCELEPAVSDLTTKPNHRPCRMTLPYTPATINFTEQCMKRGKREQNGLYFHRLSYKTIAKVDGKVTMASSV